MNRIHFSEADFKFITRLIYEKAGIVIADNKREMVFNRLVRRVSALNFENFTDYLRFLDTNEGHEEWQNFTNALTTNLTSFFREIHHFKILKAHAAASKGLYKVWSAAASTGEEPYSIAFSLTEVLGEKNEAFEILATDIDTQVLEIGQAGIYKLEQLKDLQPELIQNFFLRGTGKRSGLVKVKPALIDKIIFKQLNLLETHWQINGAFDAIFCRNVMIYFDRGTQERILKQFVPFLKPNGLLFAGHSENLSQLTKDFYSKGQTVYGLIKDKR